jgi:hypothetical protein
MSWLYYYEQRLRRLERQLSSQPHHLFSFPTELANSAFSLLKFRVFQQIQHQVLAQDDVVEDGVRQLEAQAICQSIKRSLH